MALACAKSTKSTKASLSQGSAVRFWGVRNFWKVLLSICEVVVGCEGRGRVGDADLDFLGARAW